MGKKYKYKLKDKKTLTEAEQKFQDELNTAMKKGIEMNKAFRTHLEKYIGNYKKTGNVRG